MTETQTTMLENKILNNLTVLLLETSEELQDEHTELRELIKTQIDEVANLLSKAITKD